MREQGRLSVVWRVLLGLGLLVYALFGAPARPLVPPEVEAAEDEAEGLRIENIQPVRAHPGAVVVIRVAGAEPAGPGLRATLDREPVKVVHEKPFMVAIRLPDDLDERRFKVRIVQGEERSKGRDLWVERRDHGPIVRNLLGGLGLQILGLRHLSRGLRGYAGKKMRELVATTTSGRGMRPFALGLAFGALAQSTLPSVGLIVGLTQAGLIALAPALTVLVGAQLGSSAMSLVLPVGADQEALLLIALGVAWIGMGTDRRHVAQGDAILGLGFLLFGVSLLRVGLSPLVAEPALFDQLGRATSGGFTGAAAAAAIGSILGVVTQGPAPAFGLVMSTADSTGLLDLTAGLEVLAGFWLGTAAVAAVIAWPIGPRPRRMAIGYAVLAVVGSILALASTPLWSRVADALVPGNPYVIAFGEPVLFPNVGEHLSIGFMAMQGFIALVAMLFVGRVARGFEQRAPTRNATQGSRDEIFFSVKRRLNAALDSYRECLALLMEMVRTADRSRSDECTRHLAATRTEVQEVLGDLGGVGDSEEGQSLRAFALSLTLVSGGISLLQRTVERGTEASIELDEPSVNALWKMHQLVDEVLQALASVVADDVEPNMEDARTREIRINHEEARARGSVADAMVTGDLSRALHVASLLSAYESIANHLYRAHEALAERLD
jgi:Na+/phosphate symporter